MSDYNPNGDGINTATMSRGGMTTARLVALAASALVMSGCLEQLDKGTSSTTPSTGTPIATVECVPVPAADDCEWTCGPVVASSSGFVFSQDQGAAPNEIWFGLPQVSYGYPVPQDVIVAKLDPTGYFSNTNPPIQESGAGGFSVTLTAGDGYWQNASLEGTWTIGYYGGTLDCSEELDRLLTMMP